MFNAAGFSEGQVGFPGPIPPYFGLNLFFNGETEAPGISVFAATNNSAGGPFPAFSPDSGNTLDLSGSQSVPGADSLSFLSGGLSITLTSFAYSEPLVYKIDRISNFDASADGNREYVGQFTLEVAAVPEPSSVLLVPTLLAVVATSLASGRVGKSPMRGLHER